MSTYFITSALPYVNNVPHLGNIVGSTLSADVYSRHLRELGHDVLYLCGSDQYGTATEIQAKQEKVTCKELCDKYHQLHKKVYDWFNIKFDVWGQTTTDTQTELTQGIFKQLYDNGHISEKEITEIYCSHCKLFLADRYLKGVCYHDKCKNKSIVTNGDQCDNCCNLIDINKLENKQCSVCNNIPDSVNSKHFYFALQNFKDKLKNYFIDHEKSKNEEEQDDNKCVLSEVALNITTDWLNKDLHERCITRSIKWGTPINKEFTTYNDKVFYVWFDAPIGYLSILKHNRDDWQKWLTGKIVQFMAKDNVPFHTIMYPATLMGCDYKCLPSGIQATNYLLYENQKFSKSKNIGIFGNQMEEICNKLDINEDCFRYYLMKIRPETDDSSFNWIQFISVINEELIGKIGNYLNRVLSVINKKYNYGHINYSFENNEQFTLRLYVSSYLTNMKLCKFRNAINDILEIVNHANKYFQDNKPWTKDYEDNAHNINILGNSLFLAYVIFKMLYPFIPRTAERILNKFKYKQDIFQYLYMSYVIGFDMTDYKLPFTSKLAHCKYDNISGELKKLNII